MATRVFSDDELERLRSFPDINREELIRFFTLTPAEVEFIDPRRGRGPADRLGLAVQLCTLPWLGFVPDDVAAAPPAAVGRLSERLGVPVGALGRYGEREQTRTEHLRMAARYLGWRPAKTLELKELEEFLLARAMEHDSPSLLHRLACEYLISAKVIRPGVVTLLEKVATARAAAQELTYDKVSPILTPVLMAALDRLLVVDPEIGSTRLFWLGNEPTEPSAGAVKSEPAKLRFLRRMDAHTLDLSMLPTERRRFLAAVGRRSTNQALERRDPQRRHPILLTLLAQSAVDVLDEVVQLFARRCQPASPGPGARLTSSSPSGPRRVRTARRCWMRSCRSCWTPTSPTSRSVLCCGRGSACRGCGPRSRRRSRGCHATMGSSACWTPPTTICGSSPPMCWGRSRLLAAAAPRS